MQQEASCNIDTPRLLRYTYIKDRKAKERVERNMPNEKENEDILKKIQPKIKLWLEVDGAVVFGGGRVALFQAIEETGSIKQAAEKLNMSYRAAWGKIKATEEMV